MKKQGALSRNRALLLVVVGLVVAILVLSPLISCASRNYMKMNPPPDADKDAHAYLGDVSLTCWMAAAANMLAAAGYGHGTTVQARADEIYDQIYSEVLKIYNYVGSGYVEWVIDAWLNSEYNEWKATNLYKNLEVYGNAWEEYLGTKYMGPWDEPALPQAVGNWSRSCKMVSLLIYNPRSRACHYLNAWGDEGSFAYLTSNPEHVMVTDSNVQPEETTGRDVATYDYTLYDENEYYSGSPKGWYINYDWSYSPYIRAVYALSAVDKQTSDTRIQNVLYLRSLLQPGSLSATGLHYRVGTDNNILTYATEIEVPTIPGWEPDKAPEISESIESGWHWRTVDWDLSGTPVPYGNKVEISTALVVPYSSSGDYYQYKDVYFTYSPVSSPPLPEFNCALFTPEISITNWTNICGGYIVCDFDVFDPTGQNLTGEYRFLKQYGYFQDPELHQFSLNATPTMNITQVAAGGWHTAGLTSNGTVVAVGDNDYGQCDVGNWTDIAQVAAGLYHTVGSKDDGTVVAVGRNDWGQCNVGNLTAWTDITQVAAGAWHTVGLRSDGTVVAVGRNDSGQCDVTGWTGIVQVAVGTAHTLGLKANGTVVAVGFNYSGQCNVGGWGNITQVAAGAAHTVGLKTDHTVVAAGLNTSGQCNVTGWTDITQVAAGDVHTVGLKSDGTVVAVGNNDWGQCNISWQCECAVGNLRFGHSYGFLDADHLREFDDWMTSYPEIVPLDPANPIEIELDWEGLLPYPPGAGPTEP